MMFERFTDRARKVMALANQEALRLGPQYIAPEHILLGLLKEGTGVGATVLKNLGVDLRQAHEQLSRTLESGDKNATNGKLPHAPNAKRVIEQAIAESRALGHNYVGTEHLLLGLATVQPTTAAQFLADLGATVEKIRQTVLDLVRKDANAVHATFAIAGCHRDPSSLSPPGRLLDQLIADLQQRQAFAMKRGDAESTGEFRQLVEEAKQMLRRVESLLRREDIPPGERNPPA
jgi:ATP-dependent Clp protease ATP-binding subunit ClpC